MERLARTFSTLKALFDPYVSRLNATADSASTYMLYGENVAHFKGPMFFGGVRLGRNFVSFYLMPVYTNPELLSRMSEDLTKRMLGKSGFNFVHPDEALFAELQALVHRGFDLYRSLEYVK